MINFSVQRAASGDGDAEGDGNDQGIDLAALDGYVLPGEESSEEEGDAAKVFFVFFCFFYRVLKEKNLVLATRPNRVVSLGFIERKWMQLMSFKTETAPELSSC